MAELSVVEELIGKRVVIIKKDGYKRFGILKASDAQILHLEFLDGRNEFIPWESIAGISPDLRVV